MILKLCRIELIKTRRSLALLTVVVCPVFVVLMVFLMTLKGSHDFQIQPTNWASMQMGITALWAYFMLPLYIALMTSLIVGVEHRQETWRVMLTFPVDVRQLFLAKLLIEWMLVFAAHLALLGAYALVCVVAYSTGLGTDGAWNNALVRVIAIGPIASLPILVIQHTLAWRSRHVVFPLGVAIIATMGIIQVGSSKFWVYYPWSYVLMALNGASASHRDLALGLAIGLATTLFLVSSKWTSGMEMK